MFRIVDHPLKMGQRAHDLVSLGTIGTSRERIYRIRQAQWVYRLRYGI